MIELPTGLKSQVQAGQVVLLLGAGASKGATHPEGMSPPDGAQLARALANKFLAPDLVARPLEYVADLAISEATLGAVQDFIADIYRPFQPADFHRLIPMFRWSMIATTNYDLVIERAFEGCPERLQELVPFIKNGQRVDQRLRESRSLPYLKLHGCVTKTDDPEVPLILTPEHYLTHRRQRSRLFERLQDSCRENALLVVGHSLGDSDIRSILMELEGLGQQRPRSYLVSPNVNAFEARAWQSRGFDVVHATFEELLRALDTALPPQSRALAALLPAAPHPIGPRLRIAPDAPVPQRLQAFLASDVQYIHGAIPVTRATPQDFYKGHFEGWPEIVANLDAERDVAETILTESVLPEEHERRRRQELVLIDGHAGSGKTVLLRRVAWEAAVSLERFCLYLRTSIDVDLEAFLELNRLSGGVRIFLFVDDAPDCRDFLYALLTYAKRHDLPLSVIAAARTNEWSDRCATLDAYKTAEYPLDQLSSMEIRNLLQLLERHKSLGHLEHMDDAERTAALSRQAGRRLLVALHEATLGKPFVDILIDEYNSINSEKARALYRTICMLHRLNAPVRAGLISRVHGISLSSFKDTLFKPLQGIVYVSKPDGARDYQYRSRHPYIARLVFERILEDADARLHEYLRVISALDVDFESDATALRGLVRKSELVALFPSPDAIRAIFAEARNRAPKNAGVVQQLAIYEMSIGEYGLAESLLASAIALSPRSASIQHTIAELALKRAVDASHPLERKRFRREARTKALEIAEYDRLGSHADHTLLKIALDELRDEIATPESAPFHEAVQSFERRLSEAKQRHSDDEYILDMEARFAELLSNNGKAIGALRTAFTSNPHSTYIAVRLARMMESSNDAVGARAVLKAALESNPDDIELHFALARLLETADPPSGGELVYHARKSFVVGDARHTAQFTYARAEFLYGNAVEAMDFFRALGKADFNQHVGRRVQRRAAGRFSGVVVRAEHRSARVARDGDSVVIFARPEGTIAEVWTRLRRNQRVTFGVGFNYLGPLALQIETELDGD